MNQEIGFEMMPFEIAPEFEGEGYEGEYEYEGNSKRRAARRCAAPPSST